jgi:uncharacterized protein (TIGR02996 family)
MSRDGAFLQDIIEHPDDEAPRLIYADWLDDHGQPSRAEFIRVQCELARLTEGGPRREDLRARERELLEAHGSDWRAPLPEWAFDAEFDRGFVASVAVRAAVFLREASSLWRVAPITSLTVWEATDFIAGLAACPYLACLSELRLCHVGIVAWPFWFEEIQGFDGSGAVALASSPHLGRLRRLEIGSPHHIGPEGAEALAGCPLLRGLRVLALPSQIIGEAGARALAASRHLAGVRRLNLSDNQIRGPAARALARRTAFPNLTLLDLSANPLRPNTRAFLRERFGDAVIL